MLRWFQNHGWLILFLAALPLISGCGGCGPQQKRLILLTNGDDPFWDAMREGMNKASGELGLEKSGYVAELDKNDNTPKGQVDKLNQYAGQSDIAAVAISVTDAKNVAIANAMRRLQKQGIKVITVDSDVDRESYRDTRFAYLGTDNIIGGQELGKAAKGLRPEGGKYATFVGLKSAANAVERIEGFGQAAGDGFEEVESLGDEMDLSVAQKNVRVALDNHSDINTLVGIWAYNAHAIVEVVGERGVRDNTTIVVFDAAPKALTHMKEGSIDAMVVQNPYQMGYLGTKLMKALVEDDSKTITEMFPSWDSESGEFKEKDGDINTTELRVVVPSENSPLKPENFNSDTQFYTYDQFKKWLDERNLTGS
jgi:ribose transport system substrate-binding protein